MWPVKGTDMKGFRTLHVWQTAYELTLDIYRITKNFPKEEIYALTSQLQRAIVSVSANIAEGYERNHKKEYQQFLYIAKGSLGEVETYLMLSRDLKYIIPEEYDALEEKRSRAARLLIGLIKTLK